MSVQTRLVSISFLSTLSLRRATLQHQVLWPRSNYFYPRSPCGERRYMSREDRHVSLFLSTLSLRRATIPTRHRHAGGDISIHALLAESDLAMAIVYSGVVEFLSTLSLRRATVAGRCYCQRNQNDFYPRSPCGERLYLFLIWAARIYFYPRSPCGERRHLSGNEWHHIPISIHALLAESDRDIAQKRIKRLSFLSTLSLRRATDIAQKRIKRLSFLSTLSLRRATTIGPQVIADRVGISIHALLAESDLVACEESQTVCISIHALLAESDVSARDRPKEK